MVCKVCKVPLPEGVEFFCDTCRKVIYPAWRIKFVPLLDSRKQPVQRKGVFISDAYCKVGDGRWDFCGTVEPPKR